MDFETLKKVENLNNEKFPVFPKEKIEETVKSYFGIKDKYLNLYSLYKKPLYVFEKEILKNRANEFRAAFKKFFNDTGFFFAVKCNNHPLVLRTLVENGYGADVSSGLELKTALEEGAADIVFSGPGKTEEEIRSAFENSDRVTILADSFSEIEKIDAVSKLSDKKIKVGIRLTTNPHALWRKFGIMPEKLPEFWEIIKRKRNIQFCGMQFHTSWNLNPDAQIDFIKKLGSILKDMPEDFRTSVNFLDIGGGYWPSQGEWLRHSSTPVGGLEQLIESECEKTKKLYYCKSSMPISFFAEQISNAVNEHIFPHLRCKICFEPGRWICNDAVQLLMSVVDKKSEDIAITDAATSAVGWERFEYDYFPVLNLSKPDLTEKQCNILGCLCTPHDVWGYSYWGNEISEGDVLMIPMQGAYTYSLRQNFIKPLPEFISI